MKIRFWLTWRLPFALLLVGLFNPIFTSTGRAVEVVSVPRIDLRRDDSAVVLSWPQSPVQLQSAVRLGMDSTWTPFSNTVSINAGVNTLRLDPDAAVRFFRLQSVALPTLDLTRISDTALQISWEDTGRAFVFESANQLDSGSWRVVDSTPLLVNGRYSLQLPLQSANRFFRLRLDELPPSVAISVRLSSDTGVSRADGITSSSAVEGTATPRTGLSSLRAGFDEAEPAKFRDITDVLDVVGGFALDQNRVDEISGAALTEGTHTLHLLAFNAQGQLAGRGDLHFTLDTTGPRVAVSPADGQQNVLPGQLVVATFSEPVVYGDGIQKTDVASNTMVVHGLGGNVAGRLVLDETGLRLSFVPSQDLPGNASFNILVNTTNLFDRAGNQAKISMEFSSFRTANSQGIPGTSLTGWVFSSTRNAQGGESPLVGAKVIVLNGGLKEAITDANGRFTLQDIPSGKLLLEVDGSLVATAPGTFYPTVSKLFEAVSGTATIIDSPIYLPLIQNAAFVKLSTNAPTTVANGTQLPGWSLEVPPNVVQRRDGSMAGRILISSVPPNRLPAPLPQGVDPSMVITIQTEGGADVFTQPVPLTAPNLEGLPPGAKTVLWDFDHSRGEFVPVATATVSADGKTVTTDPGQGVIRPGWHFVLNVVQDTWNLYFAKPPKKKNKKAIEDFKRFQRAVQLDVGSLGLDGASVIPGCGVVAAGAGAVTGAWRDAIAEPKKGPAPSLTKSGLLGAATYANYKNGTIADGCQRAIDNLKKGELGPASKFMKGAGKLAKGALGVFAVLNALDDYNNLQSDLDNLKKALKDPPGDYSAQVLDGIAGVEEAINDARADLIQGSIEYLEGLIPIQTVLVTYGDRPLDLGIPEPDQSQWLKAAGEIESHMAKAAALFGPTTVAKITTVLARAQALSDLMSKTADERVYYSYTPDLGTKISGSTFTQVRLTLPLGASGTVVAVEPIEGLIGFGEASVPGVLTSGDFFRQEEPIFLYPSDAPDENGNGLPDDIDAVLGNPTRAQVAALRSGLPPDEVGLTSLGIVGRLSQKTQITPTFYTANTYSDLVAGDRVLYGIGGTNVLEVIDISRPSAPVKIGAYRGGGAYSGLRAFARGRRVAVTGFGARILDVNDPTNLRVIREFDYSVVGTDSVNPVLGANHLVVAKGKELLSFDLETGLKVSAVSLAALGNPVKLELNGDLIYVLTSQLDPLQFSVTTIRLDSKGQLTFLGEIRPFFWSAGGLRSPFGLAVDDRAAFVGAWLISADPFIPGFGTINISDPAHLTVIASPSTNIVTGAGVLATDNSGHLLATVVGTQQNQNLNVYDVRDLNRTDNRIFSIALDAPPYAPSFMGGLAVFNTENDTYVARVVPIDSGGLAPVINAVILQAGAVAVEGRRVGVHVNVTDDVQVARVELFLQGDQFVASDATYPFDLDFLAPANLPHGQPLTLTVRATDTGGNFSEKTVDLTYTARAPHVASVTPIPGFITKLPLTNAVIYFDKALLRDLATAADFDLRSAGVDGLYNTADDVRVAVMGIRFNADNTSFELDFGKPLPVGKFRLTVPAAKLTDRGGNALDGNFIGTFPSGDGSFGGDFVTTFEVQHVPDFAFNAFPFRGIPTDARDYSDLRVQSGSSPLLVVDVNGDGRPDLVRTVYSGGNDTNDYHVVAVTLQQADGTYAQPVTFPAPAKASQLLAGDFNGDGKIDLVTVSFDDSAIGFPPRPQTFAMAVLFGRGDGTFEPSKNQDTRGLKLIESSRFLIGDFSGRGRAEVVQFIRDFVDRDSSTGNVLGRTPGAVLLYRMGDDGSLLAPVRTELPQSAQATFPVFFKIAAADFNRDGRLDLIVPGEKFLTPTQILMSQGDGSFSLQANTVVDDISDFVLADFTGDGEVDLVASNRLYRGLGNGKFALVPNEGLANSGVLNFPGPGTLVADFNHDGRPDLLTALTSSDFYNSTLGIFTNKTDGTFGLMSTVVLPNSGLQNSLAAADLNGDGQTDLVFSCGEGTDIPFYGVALLQNSVGGFPVVLMPASFQNFTPLGPLSLYVDLNNDGVPDPVGYFNSPTLGPTLMGFPSLADSFGPATTNSVGIIDPNYFIRALGAGDFDQDGKLDVIVSQYDNLVGSGSDQVVYFMRGNGDGTLQKGTLVPGARSLLATGDFNGDGKPDLLTYQKDPSFGAVLGLLPGKGDGTFGPAVVSRERGFSFTERVIVGDFNNDGKLDLVTRNGTALAIWLNDGTGHFALASSITGKPAQWELQAVGDFNLDGKLDVLLNDRTGTIPSYKLIVLPGDGTGRLGVALAPTPFPGVYNSNAQIIDVNGDGVLDVVTPGRAPNQLQEGRISLGNGDGTFQPPISFFGSTGGLVRVVDLNRDGLPDLLLGGNFLRQQKP